MIGVLHEPEILCIIVPCISAGQLHTVIDRSGIGAFAVDKAAVGMIDAEGIFSLADMGQRELLLRTAVRRKRDDRAGTVDITEECIVHICAVRDIDKIVDALTEIRRIAVLRRLNGRSRLEVRADHTGKIIDRSGNRLASLLPVVRFCCCDGTAVDIGNDADMTCFAGTVRICCLHENIAFARRTACNIGKAVRQ